jgi:hypothetical protein
MLFTKKQGFNKYLTSNNLLYNYGYKSSPC